MEFDKIREVVSGPTPDKTCSDSTCLTKTPLITLVIPVRNEGQYIGSTLQQILLQDYPMDRLEILVIDGLSTDDTVTKVLGFAERHPQIRLLENRKRFSSAARNIGFRQGRGDIFVIIDGHCYINDKNLLRNIVVCFERTKALCLGRPQPLNPPNLTVFQKAVAVARAFWMGHSKQSYIYTNVEGHVSPVSVGAIYKKEIISLIGYVDETFDACEDVDFNYRIEKKGLSCFFHPSLGISYYPRGTIISLFWQMYRYGHGRARFVRKHPEAFTADLVPLSLFILGVPLLVGLATLDTRFAFGAAILYGLYLTLILVASIYLSLRNKLIFLRDLPIIFVTIHLGLASGFISGMAQGIIKSRTPRDDGEG